MSASAALDRASVLRTDLETLRGRRVLFGHHSVGREILDGLRTVARDVGADASIAGSAIESVEVGQNRLPLTKLDHFVAHLERADHDGPQLALVKLCYVDFTPDTDVGALMTAYRRAVRHLRSARPALTIVHVTVPLHVRRTDWRSRLRRALGQPVWEDAANAKRQLYNQTLRATLRGEPFFDLADAESTHPDGRLEQHDVDGVSVPMLVPSYARDGAHLAEEGKRALARDLVHALAAAIRRSAAAANGR